VTDPFDALSSPVEPQAPRPAFARTLRARVASELGLDPSDHPPTVELPRRSPTMSSASATRPAPRPGAAEIGAARAVPYLTVLGAPGALDWYQEVFAAVEQLRVVGDDGRVGHAGFTIGGAEFMLSDEHPEIGVRSPESLGGTSFAIHLTVADVDAVFARAVAAGATALMEPADQPHGARHGALVDPFGHRWMVSQDIEAVSVADYAERSHGSGYEVVGTGPDETVVAADRPGSGGGIWAAAFYSDALAGIRQLVEVFGFEEQIVVVGDDGTTVVHSQLRWPEGGVVQAGTYDPDNIYSHAPGDQSLYLVTADPQAVWERCRAAGLEVVQAPYEPDHDPGGMGFTVRDLEGNIWSVGSYGQAHA
jgi:PhnB protein